MNNQGKDVAFGSQAGSSLTDEQLDAAAGGLFVVVFPESIKAAWRRYFGKKSSQ